MGKCKFQEGDKVVISPKHRNRFNGIETVGTVLQVSNKNNRAEYLVKFEGKKFYLWLKSYELATAYTNTFREDSDKEYDGLTVGEYFNRLKSNFRDICNRYLKEFCDKHDYDYRPEDWIGDMPGEIIEIADMFVSMNNIRYDIDNNIDPDLFPKWYWKGIELNQLGVEHWMNYPSFCKGAPDEWTEERIENLRTAHSRVEEAKKVLEKALDSYSF